ncbi:unnamed protein product, partial [Prunus brigantina]
PYKNSILTRYCPSVTFFSSSQSLLFFFLFYLVSSSSSFCQTSQESTSIVESRLIQFS